SPNDSLLFDVYREQANVRLAAYTPNGEDTYMKYQYFTIGRNPNSLTIDTHQTPQNLSGYYMTDSLFAYGKVPTYSLFTGIGDWNDTVCWSHLPVLRHRNALLQGNVSIASAIYCNDLFMNTGELQIQPEATLSIHNLELYDTDNSILSNGELHILGRVTLYKTLAETGKWYFISFPFDVYTSGVDPEFEQKDETPNDGGNYFYVQTYNGDKRATSNQSTGNWEVLPIQPEEKILFEKNKGYLIALDEKATENTLSFSSKVGDIPATFGQSGSVTIPIETAFNETNKENYGWYLCGNPLPAPLSLSRIRSNDALDGFIYVYDGKSYTPYAIGSDDVIPPFCAFFIKASSSTTLEVMPASTTKSVAANIDVDFPVSMQVEEPSDVKNTQAVTMYSPIQYTIKDKRLYLHEIPTRGKVKMFNLLGQCVWQKEIQPGTQVISVGVDSGVYIIQIETELFERRDRVGIY
ncbi:MAG: T9SS type A sorting domain-containing protein, partial [Parabacteroides sp.]|nr:T9SS type A sorting domain-containing protein [Parabacteroides sp.]